MMSASEPDFINNLAELERFCQSLGITIDEDADTWEGLRKNTELFTLSPSIDGTLARKTLCGDVLVVKVPRRESGSEAPVKVEDGFTWQLRIEFRELGPDGPSPPSPEPRYFVFDPQPNSAFDSGLSFSLSFRSESELEKPLETSFRKSLSLKSDTSKYTLHMPPNLENMVGQIHRRQLSDDSTEKRDEAWWCGEAFDSLQRAGWLPSDPPALSQTEN